MLIGPVELQKLLLVSSYAASVYEIEVGYSFCFTQHPCIL